MRTLIVSVLGFLLSGGIAHAQTIYDPIGINLVGLPVTTNPSDRSITVFDAPQFRVCDAKNKCHLFSPFDLDTEVPFRSKPRVVKNAAEADGYARSVYREGLTVVENCAVVQIPGSTVYRHPETLAERTRNGACIRYGYVEPESLVKEFVKKATAKPKPRHTARKPARKKPA